MLAPVYTGGTSNRLCNCPTTDGEHKILKMVIDFLQETKLHPLRFVPLDICNKSLVLISDASFANGYDLRSPLGYVIRIIDDKIAPTYCITSATVAYG